MSLLHRITATFFFSGICCFLLSVQVAFAEVEVKNQNGIAYVSGGVGKDQQEAVERLGKEFTLKVTLASHEGHYLSDGKIIVKNDAGEPVLEVTGAGPIIYVDLAPGTYTLLADVASLAGQTEERSITIGESQVTESFVWRTE